MDALRVSNGYKMTVLYNMAIKCDKCHRMICGEHVTLDELISAARDIRWKIDQNKCICNYCVIGVSAPSCGEEHIVKKAKKGIPDGNSNS